MKFYRIEYREHIETMFPNREFPCVVFRTNSWNDYHHYTTFDFNYYSAQSKLEYHSQAGIKILQYGSMETEIPTEFEALNNNYCSLGQSLEYYKFLASLDEPTYRNILDSLNDLVYKNNIVEKFQFETGFQSSLLRFSEAEKAFNEGRSILFSEQKQKDVDDKFRFMFECKVGDASENHVIEFDFSPDNTGLSRINAIIGKNGTGKTQVLAKIARSMSGLGHHDGGKFEPKRPSFSKVIAISYSVFDEFKRPSDEIDDRIQEINAAFSNPNTTINEELQNELQQLKDKRHASSVDLFSYVYCGLRTENRLLNQSEIKSKLEVALQIVGRNRRVDEWKSILHTLLKDQSIDMDDIVGTNANETSDMLYKKLSSGQRILALFMTEVIAHIEDESIILFDEPELHLHPEAISAVARALHVLLDKFNSYAIIATHSPIILQEIPSKHVIVFRRKGNLPVIGNLPIESFGENLSNITYEVFETVGQHNNFKDYFGHLIEKGLNYEEINELFDNNLSINARLALQAMISE